MRKRSFRNQLSIEVGVLIAVWVVIFTLWHIAPDDSITADRKPIMALLLLIVPIVIPIYIFQALQKKNKDKN